MINIKAASRLLNFGARIESKPLADSQLKGAVALHNILIEKKVAYLADEVGYGKTYVALGTLALFRHFNPNFRMLIIAPQENIQNKWMKEWRNFVANNIRFPDLRVKSLDGRPTRPIVKCSNLKDFVQEVSLNPNRDFFLRMTSFSLPLKGDESGSLAPSMRQKYNELKEFLPWVPQAAFKGNSKDRFKDNYARAICCAIPKFDLVIVDEAHNLKKGFTPGGSSRNRVLALSMGHKEPDSPDATALFPGFGLRAKKVLFLSATPVEDDYAQLWHQLDIFGHGLNHKGLCDPNRAKDETTKFLLRRVSNISNGVETLTKNQYRREWRRGGVHFHDEPLKIVDTRQRLTVALIQKKVSEILGDEKFNRSFQIGMLASFESFLETAKVKQDLTGSSTFDDTDQTHDEKAREGIDVGDVNLISKSYRETFRKELPHPKMDAVVKSLSNAWVKGEKSLIFVRRVASVKELKQKLDEQYDEWLKKKLLDELPQGMHPQLMKVFSRYQSEKIDDLAPESQSAEEVASQDDLGDDAGGRDSFFAWYFRGKGPPNIISGANIQRRFIQKGTVLSTFFEDNYVAEVLDCRPGEVEKHLQFALKADSEQLREELRIRSQKYLSRAQTLQRADRFTAVQAAAIELLKDSRGVFKKRADAIWQHGIKGTHWPEHVLEAPDIGDLLEQKTFFTELRLRTVLRDKIWPPKSLDGQALSFAERTFRAQLLSSAARLGHSFIDLYVLIISRIGNLELHSQKSTSRDDDNSISQINEYLDLLEKQMVTPISERGWSAFDELYDIAQNFNLICDVNEMGASKESGNKEDATKVGSLLRQQQPIGGISGKINQTLVRQFRMPGYPLVLISTDVLQEGEDLHTFCSSVHHYGISWTPSAMEQRIGRIDRVKSQTERRLIKLDRSKLTDAVKLQVYYPYLEDTYEIYQVQNVIKRMDKFLKLMHKDLVITSSGSKTLNTDESINNGIEFSSQYSGPLVSSFPVKKIHLKGDVNKLAVNPNESKAILKRFSSLLNDEYSDLRIDWEDERGKDTLLGTAHVSGRIQPFTLILKSAGPHPLVRCISPIGNVDENDLLKISSSVYVNRARLCAIESGELNTYNLTVESDVVFTNNSLEDSPRVEMLIRRVCQQADLFEQKAFRGKDVEMGKFKAELSMENRNGR